MFTNTFAILELEREPLVFGEFGQYLATWVEVAGGFSALGLLVYLLFSFARSDSEAATDQTRARWLPVIILLAVLAALAYAGAAVFAFLEPPVAVQDNKD